MKINDIQSTRPINPYKSQTAADVKSANKGKLGKDEIQISSEAKELLETHRVEGEARAKRVQQLKQSVEQGTYVVDHKLLAEKLYPFLK